MDSTIRLATADDLPAVFGLLRLMAEETALQRVSFAKVVAQIESCLERGVILLACEEDQVVGSVGLLVAQHWYTDDWHLGEQWTFVHPDHRRSRHARNLLAAAVETGKEIGLPLVMGVFTTKQTEGKCKLFARHLKTVGQIFLSEGA
jgi:predicted N-acetyltransferase YhbS